jgi:cell wall assembly regulator SMI1
MFGYLVRAMDYKSLFDTVRSHVVGQGAACEVRGGKLATEKALAKVEAEIKVRLPAELREFYRTMGNGFSLRWEASSDDNKAPFANFQVPTLKYLASMYTGWREMCLYSPAKAEKYGFPYTNDPALAKRTAARMWNWLPVIEEGNGDLICQDLSDPSCPVVFNQHDWLDGGTGDNGHLLAPNWPAFLIGWGSVCFQLPQSLYWPACFQPAGGVAWAGEEFREPYRIADLAEQIGPAKQEGDR